MIEKVVRSAEEFEKYEHDTYDVWVRKDLKGKEDDHNLCLNCARYNPSDWRYSCSIAKKLHGLTKSYAITAPVWECPFFKNMDVDDQKYWINQIKGDECYNGNRY